MAQDATTAGADAPPMVAAATPAAAGEEETRQAGLEVVAELDRAPGNIAVGPDGRIFLSRHQFYDPQQRVVELLPDGSTRPYPTEAWSAPPGADGIGMAAVLGLRVDPDGILWMLDNALGHDAVPKIVAWDTRSETLHRVIHLPPPVSPPGAFQNDLAVDPVHRALYLADPEGSRGPALIVVDLDTGFARRVLEGHDSVTAEDIDMVVDGNTVRAMTHEGWAPPRVGVNPITIDPACEWVYYGPMSGTTLYRVPAAALARSVFEDIGLAALVERHGERPISDGITMDGGGNVYITDITGNAIGVTRPDGSYRVLYRDDDLLSWADGMAFGPDGHVYVSVNRLHLSAPLNAGEETGKPPFYVVRFPALAEGAVGR